MKATALFAFAALCSPLATAQDSLAPVAGSAMTAEDAQAVVAGFAQFMEDIISSLEKVTDTTSAEEAVAVLQSIKPRAAALQAKLDNLSSADPEVQAAVFPQVIAVLMGSAERFEKALSNLQSNNFFNCESLRELISELNTQNNM